MINMHVSPRVILFTVAGILTSLAAAVPPLAILKLPLIGEITISKLLAAGAVYVAGWATKTVGDIPLKEIVPPIREKIISGEYTILKGK